MEVEFILGERKAVKHQGGFCDTRSGVRAWTGLTECRLHSRLGYVWKEHQSKEHPKCPG